MMEPWLTPLRLSWPARIVSYVPPCRKIRGHVTIGTSLRDRCYAPAEGIGRSPSVASAVTGRCSAPCLARHCLCRGHPGASLVPIERGRGGLRRSKVPGAQSDVPPLIYIIRCKKAEENEYYTQKSCVSGGKILLLRPNSI